MKRRGDGVEGNQHNFLFRGAGHVISKEYILT